MDSSTSCKSCGERTIVTDYDTGNSVCASCGVVQDFDNFQAYIGGITGPTGTNVRVGKSGSGSVYNYRETKKYEAQKLIEDLMFKLGLSGSRSNEVKLMVERITEGEYGNGRWFSVFVGACAYVVMRRDRKVLPVVEVADLIVCDSSELGRMINRIVSFLDLKLPEFDIASSLERAIRGSPRFRGVSEDLVRRMLKQGVFLVQCSMKWYLTTGRRPMPIVAAILMFVAELNQVDVKIDDLASDLHVSVHTCKKRYKELVERLVKVAQALPWGKDVTAKKILKYASCVIQYMELKSMSKRRESCLQLDGFDLNGILGDCLSQNVGYDFPSVDEENESQYFEVDPSRILRIEVPDTLQISHECLAMIYSKYLDEFPVVKSSAEGRVAHKRKRSSGLDLRACREWWTGKSDLSKKLLLEQIVEKDVGLNANPPSFDRGSSSYERRRGKINAAKLRIQRIMHPLNSESVNGEIHHLDMCAGKKRKQMQVDIDWEDFIIETLLLHQVKEEEIEKGHYNALLELHVFGDWDLR